MLGVQVGVAGSLELAVRLYVFRDEEYLGWDCFVEDQITIGSGEEADLLLDDSAVASIHACCTLNDEGITITSSGNCSLFVNSQKVEGSAVGHLDSVDIGPFTLKIKVSRKSKVTSSSRPVPQNSPEEFFDESGVQDAAYFDISPLPETENAEENELPAENKEDPESLPEMEPEPAVEVEPLLRSEVEAEVAGPEEENVPSEDLEKLRSLLVSEELEDDEDDCEEETPLSLHQSLLVEGKLPVAGRRVGKSVEVLKIRNDAVLDAAYLSGKERYMTSGDTGKFLLSENGGVGQRYFYFTKRFKGVIRESDGSTNLKDLFSSKNLFRKRGGIYRHKIPETGEVSLTYGKFDFLLRCADEKSMATASPSPRGEGFIARNLAKSSIVHVVLLLVVWQISLQQVKLPEKKVKTLSLFVQVDPLLMKQLNRPKINKVVPPVKKVVKAPPPKPKVKPKPKAKLKPKVVPKKKPKVVTKPPKKKPKKIDPVQKKVPPKVAKTEKKPSTASPKKTGRKVKKRLTAEDAMLAALSLFEDISLQPDEALAEVTNLDAVSTVNDSVADFKVGGIVEKLDVPQIRVARAGVISTKGAAQILSEGQGGERLAALEGPSSGQGEVRALVSATLNTSVKVKGGMSREEVKKVIDQHLDEISYCYESILLSKPSLSGKMVAEWTILTSGRVGDVGVNYSTVNSAEMHSCIRGAIKTWIFPKPKGAEVVVSYPFIFDVLGF